LTNLFPDLTVLENVRLAVQARAGIGLHFSAWRPITPSSPTEPWAYLDQCA